MDKLTEYVTSSAKSDAGWELVLEFSSTHRCMPDEVVRGGHIIAAHLQKLGLKPIIHMPSLYLGIPVSAQIVLPHSTIKAKASALSPAISNLKAPLIHLKARSSKSRVHTDDPSQLFENTFENEDDARKAITGHIVLTEGLSNPARTLLLQRWGAAAVIAINPGDRSHWGTNSVIWGSPEEQETNLLPKIASVAVSFDEGQKLIQTAASGDQITLSVEALHGWFKQPVITLDIASADGCEDFILLHSHYDSWEVGVGDNATGNAVLLEVARLLSQPELRLKRGVRICWWPGHSAGRYAGSTWYADYFALELEKNCVAHVNCDSPGCRDATSYASIRSNEVLGDLVKQTVAKLFHQQTEITHPGRAGDYSFYNLGISGCMLTSSMIPKAERERRGWYDVGGCGGDPAWHSEFDTLEIADQNILLNDVQLYALLVLQLAQAERLPIQLTSAFERIRLEITKLVENLGERVNLGQINALLKEIPELITALTLPDSKHFNEKARRAAQLMLRLSYTEKDSFAQDPARALPFIPLLTPVRIASKPLSPEATPAAQRALNRVQSALVQIADILR